MSSPVRIDVGPFDHVSIIVADYERALAFYEKALAPLGFKVAMTTTKAETNGTYEGAGFARDPAKLDFWIGTRAGVPAAGRSLHFAFAAQRREDVDAFYAAAIAAGAKDNGKPGVRPGPAHYYAAFVIDPDGLNLECCTRVPPPPQGV